MRERVCCDMHLHGAASRILDTFATATPYEMCAYFSDFAKRNGIQKFYMGFTDHNSSNCYDRNETADYKKQTRLSYELLEQLKKEFPNLEPVLGMESNCNLRAVSNGIFRKAHILGYADMSSEESIKKWIENKELNALSHIRNFGIEYKESNTELVSKLAYLLSINYGINIEKEEIIKKFENTNYSTAELKEEVFKMVLPELKKHQLFKYYKEDWQIKRGFNSLQYLGINSSAKTLLSFKPSYIRYDGNALNVKSAIAAYNKAMNDNLTFEEVERKIDLKDHRRIVDGKFVELVSQRILNNWNRLPENIKAEINSSTKPTLKWVMEKINGCKNTKKTKTIDEILDCKQRTELFGERVFTARNLINATFGTKIQLTDLEKILDTTSSREKMIDNFYLLACENIVKQNPHLISDTITLENAKRFLDSDVFTDGTEKYSLLKILPKAREEENASDYSNVDLLEYYSIIKNAGGYICFAHYESSFKFAKYASITKEDINGVDLNLLPSKNRRDLIDEMNTNGEIDAFEASTRTYNLFKLDMLMQMAKEKGITFDGVELTKDLIKNKALLLNTLIYCARNGYDCSFGTDLHLSELHYKYGLLKANKITKQQFNEDCETAKKNKDTTDINYILSAYTEKYDASHAQKSHNKSHSAHSLSHGIIKKVLPNEERVMPVHFKSNVSQLSLVDKIFKKPVGEDKILATFEMEDADYCFNEQELLKLRYKHSQDEHSAQNYDEEETLN